MSQSNPRRNDMSIKYTAHSTERYRAPDPPPQVYRSQKWKDNRLIGIMIIMSLAVVFYGIGSFVVSRSWSSGERLSRPTATYLSIAALPSLSATMETAPPDPGDTPTSSPTATGTQVPTEIPTQVDCIPQVVEVEIIREITSIPDPTETQVPTETPTVPAIILKANHDTEMIIRSENHKMSLIEFFVSPPFIVTALAAAALLITYAAIRIAEIRKPTLETTTETAGIGTAGRVRIDSIPVNYPTTEDIERIGRMIELLPDLKDHPTIISKIFYNMRGGSGFYKVTKAIKIIETRSTTSPPPDKDPLIDPAFNA